MRYEIRRDGERYVLFDIVTQTTLKARFHRAGQAMAHRAELRRRDVLRAISEPAERHHAVRARAALWASVRVYEDNLQGVPS